MHSLFPIRRAAKFLYWNERQITFSSWRTPIGIYRPVFSSWNKRCSDCVHSTKRFLFPLMIRPHQDTLTRMHGLCRRHPTCQCLRILPYNRDHSTTHHTNHKARVRQIQKVDIDLERTSPYSRPFLKASAAHHVHLPRHSLFFLFYFSIASFLSLFSVALNTGLRMNVVHRQGRIFLAGLEPQALGIHVQRRALCGSLALSCRSNPPVRETCVTSRRRRLHRVDGIGIISWIDVVAPIQVSLVGDQDFPTGNRKFPANLKMFYIFSGPRSSRFVFGTRISGQTSPLGLIFFHHLSCPTTKESVHGFVKFPCKTFICPSASAGLTPLRHLYRSFFIDRRRQRCNASIVFSRSSIDIEGHDRNELRFSTNCDWGLIDEEDKGR